MTKDVRHTRAGLGWLVSQAPKAPRNSVPSAKSVPPRDFFSKHPEAGNPYVSERPTDPFKGQKRGREGFVSIPRAAAVPSDVPVPMQGRGLGTSLPAPRSELPRPGWNLSGAPSARPPATSSLPAPRKRKKRTRPAPKSKPAAARRTRRPATSSRVPKSTQFVDGVDQFGFWASVFAWFLCAAAFVFLDAAAPETWQTRNSTFLDGMFGVERRVTWDMTLVHWSQLFWLLTALGAGMGLLARSSESRRRNGLPRSLIALLCVSLVSLLGTLLI